jgi:LPXTG-motif cell wall-anchored protein
MRLSWTNTEWENFSGVASKDNLLMLNAGDDFLSANGDGGNSWVDKKAYNGLKSDYQSILTADKIMTSEDLTYLQSKLAEYKAVQKNIADKRNGYNVTRAQYVANAQVAQDRADYTKRLWVYDNIVGQTEARVKVVEGILEAKAKAQAEADAKAKAKAQAEADAKTEADKVAKMKELNNQLINAKTPEEKASIQAQIDALVGKVATGGSKYITYGIVGLVLVVGAYIVFKKKN